MTFKNSVYTKSKYDSDMAKIMLEDVEKCVSSCSVNKTVNIFELCGTQEEKNVVLWTYQRNKITCRNSEKIVLINGLNSKDSWFGWNNSVSRALARLHSPLLLREAMSYTACDC